MRRRLTALALAAAALLASGCTANLGVNSVLDANGQGRLDLTLELDSQAVSALGFAGADPPETVAQRAFPWLLTEAGWTAGTGGAETVAVTRDPSGGMVLTTTHALESPNDLRALLAAPRDLTHIPGFSSVSELPTQSPILANPTFTLERKGGDSTFNLLGRAGVGSLEKAPCSGSRLDARGGPDALLRGGGLSFDYRFTLPDGPGSTNANTVLDDRTAQWVFKYGDCPLIRARSGTSSSSAPVNGIILAGAALVLLVALSLRGLRRRRQRRV
ncbi:MAG: hypothetical protein QOK40_1686 [Miltoncostaeaceae bacterium]|nr:hypothetical protein [Miltoncostaeaceae bacterium]